MEGCGGYSRSDYADDELRKLREQERLLEDKIEQDRRMANCEAEKEIRRRNIRKLGGKPCV